MGIKEFNKIAAWTIVILFIYSLLISAMNVALIQKIKIQEHYLNEIPVVLLEQ